MHAESLVREIVVHETSPATEWIGERAVQKSSPMRRHARLQLMVGAHFQERARRKGEVGSELAVSDHAAVDIYAAARAGPRVPIDRAVTLTVGRQT